MTFIVNPIELELIEKFEAENPRYSHFYESVWNYFNDENFGNLEEFKEKLLKQIIDYKIIFKL